MAQPDPEPAWGDEPDDEMDDEAFLAFECGMGPDGQCSLAGTEDCDWECPRSC